MIPPQDILAVVPVKDLGGTKSRLAPILDPDARAGLTVYMMRRVIGAALDAGAAEVCVISPDIIVLGEAERAGATAIMQVSTGLNAALDVEGKKVAAGRGARAMLVLPADLPLVEAGDISGVIGLSEENRVVISPDGERTGTNALLVCPPDGLKEFHYGIGSFGLHRDAARDAGLDVVTYDNPRLAFDLDTGLDLARLEVENDGSLPHRNVCGRGGK